MSEILNLSGFDRNSIKFYQTDFVINSIYFHETGFDINSNNFYETDFVINLVGKTSFPVFDLPSGEQYFPSKNTVGDLNFHDCVLIY